MEIDRPPSSALALDSSAARARSARDGLTLTLALDAGPLDAGQQLPGSTVVAQRSPAIESASLRVAVESPWATAVTITF
jgi:hypothetical protein